MLPKSICGTDFLSPASVGEINAGVPTDHPLSGKLDGVAPLVTDPPWC